MSVVTPEISTHQQELNDPRFEVIHLGPTFIQDVRSIRQESQHYNGFKVGALGVASTMEGDIGIFTAANRNLHPGSNPTKLCAEQNVIKQMRTAGFDRLHTMFICGPPQPDTQSGVVSPTLPSCGECRDFYEDAPEVDESTLLVQVHPTEDIIEIYTPPELEAIHEAEQVHPGNLNIYSYPGFTNWGSIVQPLLNVLDGNVDLLLTNRGGSGIV